MENDKHILHLQTFLIINKIENYQMHIFPIFYQQIHDKSGYGYHKRLYGRIPMHIEKFQVLTGNHERYLMILECIVLPIEQIALHIVGIITHIDLDHLLGHELVVLKQR